MKLTLLIFGLLVVGCARSPIRSTSDAMRKSQQRVQLADDLSVESFLKGLRSQVAILKKKQNEIVTMRFGVHEVPATVYIQALDQLLTNFTESSDWLEIHTYINEHFELYEVYGRSAWSEVFVTGYFEPILKASSQLTPPYTQALYAPPKDLVKVDLDKFLGVLPHHPAFAKDALTALAPRDRVVVGQMSEGRVGPHFSRAQIDQQMALAGQNLEIAYVDPIDAFFLQIQGSGTLEFLDGSVKRLGYAAQNGHPYIALGGFLLDKIPREEMSLQAIEAYLRNMPADQQKQLLATNPSYVFFEVRQTPPLTFFGNEVVDGRTIATDSTYFPKGALAFLSFQDPLDGMSKSRYVLDQDIGGAIRGPHRVDLFFGRGEQAKLRAGKMKSPGKLFYLVPKDV